MNIMVLGNQIRQIGFDQCPVKQNNAISILENPISNISKTNDAKNVNALRPYTPLDPKPLQTLRAKKDRQSPVDPKPNFLQVHLQVPRLMTPHDLS